MHITLLTFVLAVATSIVASPLSTLNSVNNACYYKRSINEYVRRSASNAEVLCGPEKQRAQPNAKRSHNIALASTGSTGSEGTTEKRSHRVTSTLNNSGDDTTNGKRSHKNSEAKSGDDATNRKRSHRVTSAHDNVFATLGDDTTSGYKDKRSHKLTSTSHGDTVGDEITNEKRGHKIALASTGDDSTNGKRSHRNTEAKTGDETNGKRSHIKQAKTGDQTTNGKRSHKIALASADPGNTGDGTYKRVPPPNNACYYKRNLETGELIAYKRNALNAEIYCG